MHDTPHLLFKILFGIDVCALMYFIFVNVKNLIRNKRLNSYNDNICKIINDYSSIMVKIKEINLKKFIVVKVESFDDLLVVYNDVRTPINFIQMEDEARFIIIFENMAWEYSINRESVEDYGEC